MATEGERDRLRYWVFVCERPDLAAPHPMKVGFTEDEYAEERCPCGGSLRAVEMVAVPAPREDAARLGEELVMDILSMLEPDTAQRVMALSSYEPFKAALGSAREQGPREDESE